MLTATTPRLNTGTRCKKYVGRCFCACRMTGMEHTYSCHVCVCWNSHKHPSKQAHFEVQPINVPHSEMFIHFTHNRFTALFPVPPGWAGARKDLLGFMVQAILTKADTPTMRLDATPSRLTSAHLHHPLYFLQAGCPSCRLTNSVKAPKATSAFGLGRRR